MSVYVLHFFIFMSLRLSKYSFSFSPQQEIRVLCRILCCIFSVFFCKFQFMTISVFIDSFLWRFKWINFQSLRSSCERSPIAWATTSLPKSSSLSSPTSSSGKTCVWMFWSNLFWAESHLNAKKQGWQTELAKQRKKADVSLWRRLSNKRIHLTKISMVNQALQIHSM